jgi:pimeloyl-ACP methyl ester carboxylesterase
MARPRISLIGLRRSRRARRIPRPCPTKGSTLVQSTQSRSRHQPLCEIYRELDHDADIHRADVAAHGKLTVPVLASGGAQTLAANYAPMCEEVAIDVTGHLVPDAGHWVAEENPDYFCRMFIEFDTSARTRPEPAQPLTPAF